MQKAVKIGVILALVLMLGMMSADALQEWLATFENYNLSSGSHSLVNGRSAGYDYAYAEMQVNSITSGTKKTDFVAYRWDNSFNDYLIKAKYTHSLSTGSKRAYIGRVVAGTWRLCNYAESYQTGTDYAGWSGKLSYYSSTEKGQ